MQADVDFRKRSPDIFVSACDHGRRAPVRGLATLTGRRDPAISSSQYFPSLAGKLLDAMECYELTTVLAPNQFSLRPNTFADAHISPVAETDR
jgi:hypothetical protein